MLILQFGRGTGAPPPPEPWRTAAATDATDAGLRELRRRAVDPVVGSLLTPDELASSHLFVYREAGTRTISLWLAAGGEQMQHWLWNPDFGQQGPPDPLEVATHLADSMEDWVCETRFAWGQHRIAVYQVPPP